MESPVTRRYARALYEVAVKGGILDRVGQDVQLIGSTVDENPRILIALHNPEVPRNTKKAILAEIFGQKVDPLTLRFTQLLIDKGRASVLPSLQREFEKLADVAAGIVRARVQSAVALTPVQEGLLVKELAALTGKKVMLKTSVDPSIGGGAVVWIGDRVIDGSVAGYLKAMESSLAR